MLNRLVGADRVRLHHRRAVRQQVRAPPAARRSLRVGDQHEQVEERAGRALRQEPRRRRRRDAGALVPRPEELIAVRSRYIARSTMIGWHAVDTRRHVRVGERRILGVRPRC